MVAVMAPRSTGLPRPGPREAEKALKACNFAWTAPSGAPARMNNPSSMHVSAETTSDEELIGLVLSGQPEYFYELVKPHERRVYLAAFGILQNRADAEDVAQEAILKAFRHLNTFRKESRFCTWLLRITINEAYMWLRKRKWDQLSLPEESDEEREYTPLLLVDWREIPSEALERREVREHIEKGLASLPEHYREVLVLRDVEGLSIAETASVLGISEGQVKTRSFRARLRIRDFLAPRLRKSLPPRAFAGRKRGQ